VRYGNCNTHASGITDMTQLQNVLKSTEEIIIKLPLNQLQHAYFNSTDRKPASSPLVSPVHLFIFIRLNLKMKYFTINIQMQHLYECDMKVSRHLLKFKKNEGNNFCRNTSLKQVWNSKMHFD
jgi:hypothetical protein